MKADPTHARRILPLPEYVTHLSPKYSAPLHLKPFTDRLELALRGVPQQVVVHAPPRHAKTETCLHFIPWALDQQSDWTLAYVTYASDLAESKSRKAQMLARRAGVQLATTAMHEWRTTDGGGLLATGIGGPLTGHGVNIGIVDDPVKNRAEAESATFRERNWDWFNDVLFTRIEPGGSVFVFQTRWHPDDLAGRLIKQGWEFIRLPAIDELERPLWPQRWTMEALLAKKEQVGGYTWTSLYQGEPRPRGGAVFGDATTFTERHSHYRVGIGLDFAYTEKTSSDASVAVVVFESDGVVQVVEVIRQQVAAPKFKHTLRALRQRYPTAKFRAYAKGTETGSIDFFKQKDLDGPGIPIEALPPKGDKFVRATPVAAAWNNGAVRVPVNAPWLERFLSELAAFTGVKDPEDDQVDALAAGYDVVTQKAPGFDGLPSVSAPPRM